jgi:TonB family protein
VIAWMCHALAVAALSGVAAVAAERAARLFGAATRWFWAAALAITSLGPLTLWSARSGAVAAQSDRFIDGIGGASVGGLGVVGAPPAGWGLDAWIAAGLVAATLLATAVIAFGGVRLALRRRRWRRGRMDGEPVLVSRDTGPAVVGVVRGEIVVPTWAFSLEASDRACLLAHERSHLRAGDPRLVSAALALAALAAWNPLVWWQIRRLRLAIEMDCDARVLRAVGDVGRYGRALLAVGAMRARRPEPLMAFAEPASHLERRIMAMSEPRPARRGRRAATLAAAASLAVTAACAIPRPVPPAPDLSIAALRPVSSVRASAGAHVLPGARAEGVASRRAHPTDTALQPALAADTPVVDLGDRPAFTPRTREPELPADQRGVLMQYLERNYPDALREAGIGARTTLWAFIDEQGRTGNTRILESSGYPAFDEVAQRALRTVTWQPAMNRAERVPVWIQLPISYQVRGGATPAEARRVHAAARPAAQPRLLNRDEVVAAAARAAGGARGRVEVWISVDLDGSVAQVRLAERSGSEMLDQAALEAAALARFAPAHDRGEAVPVWIRFPVVVQADRN